MNWNNISKEIQTLIVEFKFDHFLLTKLQKKRTELIYDLIKGFEQKDRF